MMTTRTIISTLGILIAVSMFTQKGEAAIVDFHCSNPPAKVWGQYYAVMGETSNFATLKVVSFGIFEGSNAAEEEEPVNTVEEFIAKVDASQAASSAGWKSAVPFDLTTADLGKATFYLKQKDFVGKSGTSIARLKFDGKDLRLSCQFTTR